MRKGIEEFKSTINSYLHLWKSVELITFCIKFENKWINLATKILLKEEKIIDPQRAKLPISLPKFKVIIKKYDINELPQLISKIQDGILKIGKHKIIFKGRLQNDIKNTYEFEFRIYEKRYQWYMYYEDYPVIELNGEPRPSQSLFDSEWEDEINRQLGILSRPFENIGDVAEEYLGSRKPIERRVGIATILAYVPIKFDDRTELLEEKISIRLEVSKSTRKKYLNVGVIERYYGGKTDRYLAAPEEFKSKKENGKHYLIYDRLVDDCYAANILLSYCGTRIDKIELFSTIIYTDNPKLILHDYFDPVLENMRKYLRGKGKKPSIDFESGVTWLLYTLGFSVVNYGRENTIEGEIDLIAFDPKSNIIIAGECTTKEPDLKGKLSSLSRKVEELRGVLPQFAILPVIFTPLEKIPNSDTDKAGKNGIVVVNGKDLFKLLDMAIERKSPSKIIDKLDSLLPYVEGARYNWKEPLYHTKYY